MKRTVKRTQQAPAVAVKDGYQNIVANLGTARDKAAHSTYIDVPMNELEAIAFYNGSWLAQAFVDNPPEDATRNWRKWRGTAPQITKIEALEKKLFVSARIREGVSAARLQGGAAVYINTGERAQDTPLRPGTEIKSLVVLGKNALTPVEIVQDINSVYYGGAEKFRLNTNAGNANVEIHASRLIIFMGAKVPGGNQFAVSQFWGRSILQGARDAIMSYESTIANTASLVFEAKVDVFKFKGLTLLLQDNRNDAQLIRRLNLMAAQKGINGAVMIDMEDDYQQKSANFSGLPDVIGKLQENASGATQQPVTRLLGRASAGLSGSGDGDERVYYDRVANLQTDDIGPAMAHFDECLITQALAQRPADIHYEWAPLRQQTQKDRADIFGKIASGARAIAGTAEGTLIGLEALSTSLANEFTEQGLLPGLDQAIKKFGNLENLPRDDNAGTNFADAAPAPLYVSRKVLNAKEILAHYQKQGVDNLTDASDLHVTVTYSREPVEWLKMGETWGGDLKLDAGGARVMEAFGANKDTLVLSFVSSQLSWRHESMVQAGASWDFPEYQPHISISYSFSGNIADIDPWRGEIRLGAEIFEALEEK